MYWMMCIHTHTNAHTHSCVSNSLYVCVCVYMLAFSQPGRPFSPSAPVVPISPNGPGNPGGPGSPVFKITALKTSRPRDPKDQRIMGKIVKTFWDAWVMLWVTYGLSHHTGMAEGCYRLYSIQSFSWLKFIQSDTDSQVGVQEYHCFTTSLLSVCVFFIKNVLILPLGPGSPFLPRHPSWPVGPQTPLCPVCTWKLVRIGRMVRIPSTSTCCRDGLLLFQSHWPTTY